MYKVFLSCDEDMASLVWVCACMSCDKTAVSCDKMALHVLVKLEQVFQL